MYIFLFNFTLVIFYKYHFLKKKNHVTLKYEKFKKMYYFLYKKKPNIMYISFFIVSIILFRNKQSYSNAFIAHKHQLSNKQRCKEKNFISANVKLTRQ